MRVLFVLVLCALPNVARADDAAAQRHFEAGQVAFVRRAFEEAAKEFEAAYDESPHPAALFNAGVAWAEAARGARACNCLKASLQGEGLTAAQTAEAKKRVAALSGSLATIKVTAAPGAVVRLDGHCPVPAPVELMADEGAHVIRVDIPGGPPLSREVTVPGGGASVSVDIRPEEKRAPPPPPPPPVVEPEPWLSGRRIAGFVTLGSSLAFGAAALGIGLTGISARDEFVETGRTDRELHDDALRLRDTANVLWGVGAGALVVGTLLVALPSLESTPETTASIRVHAGPGSALVSGTW